MEIIECEDFLVYGQNDFFIGDIKYSIEENNKVFINLFQVYEEYREFGLGKEMLIDMISYFKKEGYDEILLEAIPLNSSMSLTSLISFYMKSGFEYLYKGTNYLKLNLKKDSYGRFNFS